MHWVEVIQLRITRRNTRQVVAIVQKLASEARTEGTCRSVRMCRRADIDTDLCLLFFHENPPVQGYGSTLGIRISAALKEFGMVNHNTWVEVHDSCTGPSRSTTGDNEH